MLHDGVPRQFLQQQIQLLFLVTEFCLFQDFRNREANRAAT